MTDSHELKVFISWSGGLAQTVAQELRSWLPGISDRIVPFMSDADIAAGQRGLSTIEKELAGTTFGIIVVTRQNQDAPWLNFEAGALSRVVEKDIETRVAPLLIDIPNPSQITGPISQFQAKVFNQGGMLELVQSIAAVAGADPATVEKRFNAFWEELYAKVDKAVKVEELVGEPQPRTAESMIEETLNIVRAMRSEQAPVRDLTMAGRAPQTSRGHDIQKFAADLSTSLEQQGLHVVMIREASDDDPADFDVRIQESLEAVDANMIVAKVRSALGVTIRFIDKN